MSENQTLPKGLQSLKPSSIRSVLHQICRSAPTEHPNFHVVSFLDAHLLNSHHKHLVWCSGDRSFYEAIPTLHWCPDDRLSEGGTPFPCLVFPSSPCVLVGRAGCTLLGGLVSKENWTVLRMGFVIVPKSSHDHGYTGRLVHVSHPYLNEIALVTM